jgi:hypothetical protein
MGKFPSGSRWQANRLGERFSFFATGHMRVPIKIINPAKSRSVRTDGMRAPIQAPAGAPRIPPTPKITPGSQSTFLRWKNAP